MTKNEYKRNVVVYKHYFIGFKKTLSLGTLKKIYQIFLYIMTLDYIPANYMKAIKGVPGLYEIRIEDNGNLYRIFCCFDEGNLVVLFNAFQKKTQKTPRSEIDKARMIMKDFYENKKRLQV